MTNGYCQTHCMQEYAFAITQYQSCWCSNYAPAKSTEVDDDRCSTICPAWKEERCGGPGVFAYIVLANIAPSGTRGPLPSSTTSESSKSTDEVSGLSLSRSLPYSCLSYPPPASTQVPRLAGGSNRLSCPCPVSFDRIRYDCPKRSMGRQDSLIKCLSPGHDYHGDDEGD
jgi:hypothetical protein